MEGDQGAETARMFLPEDIAKGSSDSTHPPCCLGFTTSTWCGGEKAAFVVDQNPGHKPSCLAVGLCELEQGPYSLGTEQPRLYEGGMSPPRQEGSVVCGLVRTYKHSLPPL